MGNVFSNLRMIYAFHSESILDAIRPRIENWTPEQTLGDIFLRLTAVMKIYTQYISNYTNSTLTQRRLLHTSAEWKEWKAAQEAKANGMTLASFLIMPIQRVPRYVMLLADLNKHTAPSHPDKANLQQAAEEMEVLTRFLDSRKEEYENMERLAALYIKLDGRISINLAAPSRKFLREDKFGDRLTVYLFSDLLLLCRTVPAPTRRSKWNTRAALPTAEEELDCHYYPLEQVNVLTNDGCFQIRKKGTQEIILSDKELIGPVGEEWKGVFQSVYRDSNAAFEADRITPRGLSKCDSLMRTDSIRLLENDKSMVQNHLSLLDIQIKTKRSKAEKEDLMNIRQSFSAQARRLEQALNVKVAKRRADVCQSRSRSRSSTIGGEKPKCNEIEGGDHGSVILLRRRVSEVISN